MESPESIPPARALISASNLHRRAACPGSARAEQAAIRSGVPEPETTYAAEGTLLHWHDAHPDEPRDNLEDNQIEALERNAKLREIFLKRERERLSIPDDAVCQRFVEREFWLEDGKGQLWTNPATGEHLPGHPDLVLYWPDHKLAIIFDSKFGRVEVPKADVNWQLKVYVSMFSDQYDCTCILAAITQPLVVESFHAVEYEASDFPQCRADILAALSKTMEPKARRVPSGASCAYCRARGTEYCYESLAIVEEAAQEYSVLRVQKLPVAKLEEIHQHAHLINSTLESVEERIRHIARWFPELLNVFQLGNSSILRTIPDALAAWRVIREAGDLLDPEEGKAVDEFLYCCDISRVRLEKLIAKNRGIPLDIAVKKLRACLGYLLVETKGAPKLIKKT